MADNVQQLILLVGILAGLPVAPAVAETAPPTHGSPVSTEAADLRLAQGLTQITGVRVVSGSDGWQLFLDADGDLAQPTLATVGNALIVDIDNATLALPEGDRFDLNNPTEDIALISVNAIGANQVRIAITGLDGPPTATVSSVGSGLALTIGPTVARSETSDDTLRIAVTGSGDEGYNPTQSSTATGTETPLRDVPFSVQVIPRAVIEDRNVAELGKALETASGVVSAGGRGSSVFGPGFFIRGFNSRGGIFRDGIQSNSLAPLSSQDLERVEVLKGPASILFGQGEPGGIINLVSKKPLPEPRYATSLTIGNFDSYRGDFDISGPLTPDQNLRYRLNFSYEDYGSFRDFVNGKRLLISPILAWDITDKTSIEFYGQHTWDRETIDEGIPVGASGIIDIPRNRFLNEDFGEFSQSQFNLGYRFRHEFSDSLSLRHSLQYQQYSPERFVPFFDDFDETTGLLARSAYFAGGTYRRFFTNVEAIGKFNTGSVKHQVLFGVEYRNTLEKPEFQFGIPYPAINVFNPVYTRTPFAVNPFFFRDDRIQTIGIYLQDQIEILENLKLLAGVRYDWSDQFRTTQILGEPREEFEQTDSAFSPRFGLIYQPIEPVSLYASYTTSFSPSFGASLNADGSNFDPETGRQIELGVKADVTDQLSINFALFDIRRQNVQTPDPNNPQFSLQTGEVASRGLELSVNGSILPGWNLTAAYTFLDAFVSKDNTFAVGNQLANIPDHQFSLWSTYEIQSGNLQGLGLGLGFFYLSDRPGNLDNTFTLPSYFRTDAALFYRRNNWRVQLNLENLFNINYFTVSDEFLGVTPGAPLTVSGKVSVEF
ncbi:TonB-dependent siderophore receptor [Synechococcales cyanobacterium C]|uniref:TonB-dependent siderophore receptor n=1 Tax=Petrachloros mirabilis ULC683 TaxID=2781853 RepID=A0A8K2A0E4_9CYAN|nr:TonB-dependent siderophore receptor [Petrachloros mirabilis]NCJ07452.1 TonB-dependent siderophore receptor [Petrachloros mirabilis ULC683]